MKKWLSNLFRTPAGMYLSVGMLVGASATVGMISYNAVTAKAGSPPSRVELTMAEENALGTIENAFAKIVDEVSPAVVSIQAKHTITNNGGARGSRMFQFGPGIGSPDVVEGTGSGVVVRSDGWILTNDHVVRGADKVTVVFSDGKKMEGTVRRDFLSDIAVVKVDANGLHTLPFGDSNRVRAGQFAIAIGSPFGLENTVTIGHISALSRSQGVPDQLVGTMRYYPTMIQTDAAINPGNSGGPLINIHGELVGINTAIASEMGGSVGVGFAIPINNARDVAEQLIQNGKVSRGYLGVEPADITPEDKDRLNIDAGALVKRVTKDEPAYKAGIREDDVITDINGTKIEKAIDLRMKLLHIPAGQDAKITLIRNGKQMTVDAKVIGSPLDVDTNGGKPAKIAQDNSGGQEFVDPFGGDGDSFGPPVSGRLGVAVAEPSKDVLKEYNLPSSVQGVVVTDVERGSAAARFGIKPGDVIETFNGKKLRTPDQLKDLVTAAKGSYDLVLRRKVGEDLATLRISIKG